MFGSSFLRWQTLLAASALLLSLVQWFLVGNGGWSTTMVYTLVAGNLVSMTMAVAIPFLAVPFPENWTRYLLLLLPVSVVASVVGGVVNRLILGKSLSTLAHWRTGELPFAALVSYATGVIIFAFVSNRTRLEAEKRVLVQQVQRGERALETHAAELQAAFEIQSRLLPLTVPQIAGVEISCAWQPAQTVSGDFFDVLVLEPHRIGFCVADVSGKGMSAALVTANLQAAFRAFAPAETSPARVCQRLNQALCASLPTGKFVTLVYGIVDRQTMQLTYELAGHNSPLLLRYGDVRQLEGTGPILGMLPGALFADQVIQLQAGDRLLVATDGVTEAFQAQSQEEFGEARMVAAALRTKSGSVPEMLAEVMREVTVFAEGQFADDASLMVIGMLEAGKPA